MMGGVSDSDSAHDSAVAADLDPAELRRLVDRLAYAAGFDLVAVSDAADFAADRDETLRRIDAGRMDGLPWFTKARVERGTRPAELLPGARSIITVGLNYYAPDDDVDVDGDDSDGSDGPPSAAGRGIVARYARGRDYHRVMKRRLRRLTRDLSAALGRDLAARWHVDDGPMLDRTAAARAGLGWFGKNGNILTPQLGSWVLIGQLLTDLPLPPDAPLAKTCGQCARCIPACPTDAIVAPYVVDNRRCISYQTIENRGVIPRELRAAIGNWVFGCDICQEVCPVNRKARATGDANFGRRDLAHPDLVELLTLTEAQFRERFAGTPVMRAKWVGMRRNASIALGNGGDPASIPPLAQALADADPLVRQHAAWALGRIGGAGAADALRRALADELDDAVREEIGLALGELSG